MKINEITEAPVSGIRQAAQGLGSRVLNRLGAKDAAANLAGRADLSATANNLNREFVRYLGTQGKSTKQATGRDLKAFLDTKNVDTSGIPNGVLGQNRINAVMLQKSRQAMAGKGAKKAAPAATEPVSSQYAQAKDAALKLSAKEKDRLIAALGKSIKRKPAKQPTVVDKNFDKSQRLSQYGKVGR